MDRRRRAVTRATVSRQAIRPQDHLMTDDAQVMPAPNPVSNA
jgi:hypothetical protein